MKYVLNKKLITFTVILLISLGINVYQTVKMNNYYQTMSNSTVQSMERTTSTIIHILDNVLAATSMTPEEQTNVIMSSVILNNHAEELMHLSNLKGGLDFSLEAKNIYPTIGNFFLRQGGPSAEDIEIDEEQIQQIELIRNILLESRQILKGENSNNKEIFNSLSKKLEGYTNTLRDHGI